MNGVPSPAIGSSPCSVRRWSTMAPQPLNAGDQITGGGPSVASSHPSTNNEASATRGLRLRLDDDTLTVDVGPIGLVERTGEVGQQLDLLGGDGHVDDDAVARTSALGISAVLRVGGVVTAARSDQSDENKRDQQSSHDRSLPTVPVTRIVRTLENPAPVRPQSVRRGIDPTDRAPAAVRHPDVIAALRHSLRTGIDIDGGHDAVVRRIDLADGVVLGVGHPDAIAGCGQP